MRTHDIAARQQRRFRTTTDSRHQLPVADNRLRHDFHLAAVMDLFSRRIVGWSMRERIDTQVVIAAQQMAIEARMPPTGLLHHSDRGS